MLKFLTLENGQTKLSDIPAGGSSASTPYSELILKMNTMTPNLNQEYNIQWKFPDNVSGKVLDCIFFAIIKIKGSGEYVPSINLNFNGYLPIYFQLSNTRFYKNGTDGLNSIGLPFFYRNTDIARNPFLNNLGVTIQGVYTDTGWTSSPLDMDTRIEIFFKILYRESSIIL